jgi:hypothetical protein
VEQQRTVRVGFACNDPRSGACAGRVERVTIHDGIDVVIDVEGDGLAYVHRTGPPDRAYLARPYFVPPKGVLRLDGQTLVTHGYATWAGNWCWDAAVLRELDVWRLLEHLRRRAWCCTEAEWGVYAAWHAGRPLEAALRRALGT